MSAATSISAQPSRKSLSINENMKNLIVSSCQRSNFDFCSQIVVHTANLFFYRLGKFDFYTESVAGGPPRREHDRIMTKITVLYIANNFFHKIHYYDIRTQLVCGKILSQTSLGQAKTRVASAPRRLHVHTWSPLGRELKDKRTYLVLSK